MQNSSPPVNVSLKGSFLVERASALRDELVSALGRGGDVALDFAPLEDIDLACLQVIRAAGVSARASSRSFHFHGALPPRVAERLAACGFLVAGSLRSEDLEMALSGE